MSLLKKGNIIALAAGAGLVWLAAFLFMDPLLKRVLVRGGEAAVGAKVEAGSLTTRVLSGTLRLRRFAAADKDRPMTNLFEFDEALLRLDRSAALRGKLVIDEASLTGLRFGTPRRTSGALRRPPQDTFVEKLVKEQLGAAQDAGLSGLEDVKADAKVEVDAAKLACLRRIDEAKAGLDATAEKWTKKAESYKALDAEVKQAVDELKSLKGGSPQDILASAQKVRQAQEKLKGLLAKVDADKRELAAELETAKAGLRKAQELKGKDLDGLLAAAGLPSLDAASLSRRLLGPEMSRRVSQGLYWLHWARQRSAKKPAAKDAERPRRKGLDIEFPLRHRTPSFLLELARLTGSAQDIAFEGTLAGATSDAPLYGKPAKLTLSGKGSDGRSLMLEGVLDQVREPGTATVDFDYGGVPLAGLDLGDGQLGGALSRGSARVHGRLRLQGEQTSGEIVLEADGVELEPRVGLGGAAGRLAKDALKGIRRFRAVVGVLGTGQDLKFTLSSDMGQTIADALKRGVSDALAEQRKALQAKLDALYEQKAAELRSRTGALESSLLGPLLQREGTIDKAIKDSASKALGKPGIPGLDRLFK